MVDISHITRKIRALSLKMIYEAGSGHPGGSLSCADILAYLYFKEMEIHPESPTRQDRDRFVLSKGHACPALYATLALRGFFPVNECFKFRKFGALLQGHPDGSIPGIDAVSGSLGMGLSQGLGMALSSRISNSSFYTYVLLGDGDMEEGNTWEAIMASGHHKMSNLIAILDANDYQGDSSVSEQMDYTPVKSKLSAFKWDYYHIDGHDIDSIQNAFLFAKTPKMKPTFIHANTVKGKGVSFMEGENAWHGSRSPTESELKQALQELEGR